MGLPQNVRKIVQDQKRTPENGEGEIILDLRVTKSQTSFSQEATALCAPDFSDRFSTSLCDNVRCLSTTIHTCTTGMQNISQKIFTTDFPCK